MQHDEFQQDIYNLVRQIPRGKVTTYGQIAYMLGRPKNSRLVGQAMRLTPSDASIPSHRVVNSQGRLVPGWSAQYDLLKAEGIPFTPNGNVRLKNCFWQG
ncbi:cysteine methyltransferase [Listeria newyorkensis]|uniref:Cysteine methyltransferase n=1 Tax=Listeria newyorkensis TaxID=1497681 RepID=A0ABX4XK07_9LIST|nr:methylated-DNA--[protein]-cysteine S-methyltransferase [Listeria newyorkensis]KGL37804.1 cysteine methyltransferase [Listeria newyorkensis]PNP90602.1 cysteine methyltransferase [Listeria newyorkensis]WAO23256.1 methylated-DNA--[protein]-cysteine S-methyltransferase [Listeria newyorkensis]SQC56593.1 Methylated-DNA--protein-cysteine methyltransferase [Listeria newyorkensis]